MSLGTWLEGDGRQRGGSYSGCAAGSNRCQGSATRARSRTILAIRFCAIHGATFERMSRAMSMGSILNDVWAQVHDLTSRYGIKGITESNRRTWMTSSRRIGAFGYGEKLCRFGPIFIDMVWMKSHHGGFHSNLPLPIELVVIPKNEYYLFACVHSKM